MALSFSQSLKTEAVTGVTTIDDICPADMTYDVKGIIIRMVNYFWYAWRMAPSPSQTGDTEARHMGGR